MTNTNTDTDTDTPHIECIDEFVTFRNYYFLLNAAIAKFNENEKVIILVKDLNLEGLKNEECSIVDDLFKQIYQLRSERSFNLGHKHITVLPNEVYCNYCTLSYSRITSLPSVLYVTHNLDYEFGGLGSFMDWPKVFHTGVEIGGTIFCDSWKTVKELVKLNPHIANSFVSYLGG